MFRVIWRIDQGPNLFGGRLEHCELCGEYKTYKGAMKKATALKSERHHRNIEIWSSDNSTGQRVVEIIGGFGSIPA